MEKLNSKNRINHPLSFVIAATSMVGVTYGVGRYAFGVFIPEARQEYLFNTFEIGVISSVCTIFYILANIFCTIIVFNYSPRAITTTGSLVTSIGLLLVGIDQGAVVFLFGVALASIGAGIHTPATFEAIVAWLDTPWRERAMGAVNAGAMPGKIITGIVAAAVGSSWHASWLILSFIGFAVTFFNFIVTPSEKLSENKLEKDYIIVNFTNLHYMPFYIVLILYGIIYGVYLTFFIDYVNSFGKIEFTYMKMMWPVIALSGLLSINVGKYINKYGETNTLVLCFVMCAISYVLIAFGQGGYFLSFVSVVIFGIFSIAPGAALMIWGIQLFNGRASIASTTVFLFQSIGFSLGPFIFGWASQKISYEMLFYFIAIISVFLSLICKNADNRKRQS